MVDGPFPSNPYSITPTQDYRDQRSAYYVGQQQQANAGVPEIFQNPFIPTKKQEFGYSTAYTTPQVQRPANIPTLPTPTPIPTSIKGTYSAPTLTAGTNRMSYSTAFPTQMNQMSTPSLGQNWLTELRSTTQKVSPGISEIPKTPILESARTPMGFSPDTAKGFMLTRTPSIQESAMPITPAPTTPFKVPGIISKPTEYVWKDIIKAVPEGYAEAILGLVSKPSILGWGTKPAQFMMLPISGSFKPLSNVVSDVETTVFGVSTTGMGAPEYYKDEQGNIISSAEKTRAESLRTGYLTDVASLAGFGGFGGTKEQRGAVREEVRAAGGPLEQMRKNLGMESTYLPGTKIPGALTPTVDVLSRFLTAGEIRRESTASAQKAIESTNKDLQKFQTEQKALDTEYSTIIQPLKTQSLTLTNAPDDQAKLAVINAQLEDFNKRATDYNTRVNKAVDDAKIPSAFSTELQRAPVAAILGRGSALISEAYLGGKIAGPAVERITEFVGPTTSGWLQKYPVTSWLATPKGQTIGGTTTLGLFGLGALSSGIEQYGTAAKEAGYTGIKKLGIEAAGAATELGGLYSFIKGATPENVKFGFNIEKTVAERRAPLDTTSYRMSSLLEDTSRIRTTGEGEGFDVMKKIRDIFKIGEETPLPIEAMPKTPKIESPREITEAPSTRITTPTYEIPTANIEVPGIVSEIPDVISRFTETNIQPSPQYYATTTTTPVTSYNLQFDWPFRPGTSPTLGGISVEEGRYVRPVLFKSSVAESLLGPDTSVTVQTPVGGATPADLVFARELAKQRGDTRAVEDFDRLIKVARATTNLQFRKALGGKASVAQESFVGDFNKFDPVMQGTITNIEKMFSKSTTGFWDAIRGKGILYGLGSSASPEVMQRVAGDIDTVARGSAFNPANARKLLIDTSEALKQGIKGTPVQDRYNIRTNTATGKIDIYDKITKGKVSLNIPGATPESQTIASLGGITTFERSTFGGEPRVIQSAAGELRGKFNRLYQGIEVGPEGARWKYDPGLTPEKAAKQARDAYNLAKEAEKQRLLNTITVNELKRSMEDTVPGLDLTKDTFMGKKISKAIDIERPSFREPTVSSFTSMKPFFTSTRMTTISPSSSISRLLASETSTIPTSLTRSLTTTPTTTPTYTSPTTTPTTTTTTPTTTTTTTSTTTTSSTSPSSTAGPKIIPLFPSIWPSLGALPGGMEAGKGVDKMVGGVNVNFLRNLFFEKIQSEIPGSKNIMVSGLPKSFTVPTPNLDKNMAEMLGKNFYTGIVSNSTPFPKGMIKRRVK